MKKHNRIFLIAGLLIILVAAAAFFIAQNAVFAPVAGTLAEESLRKELEQVREMFLQQSEELEQARKEVPQRVYEYRKAAHTRTHFLSPDAVAVELAALLEQSRREQPDGEL